MTNTYGNNDRLLERLNRCHNPRAALALLCAVLAIAQGNRDTITPETKFADLGIDSLTTVEILMDIEDEFGVSLEAGQIGTTVGELIAKIEEAQA